jgi:hypothetical protein
LVGLFNAATPGRRGRAIFSRSDLGAPGASALISFYEAADYVKPLRVRTSSFATSQSERP